MLPENIKVLQKGDASGNGMVVRFRLPSGLEILALPTENFYGGEWDLGPTWNYLVCSNEPFLVDTGKFDMGGKLLSMMAFAGFSENDLKSIVISHGHEDHDGGLFEIARTTGATVKAHWIYERLIRPYPETAPNEEKSMFPASCWHCFMPASFSDRHCRVYHRERGMLEIKVMEDDHDRIDEYTTTFHLPGHSPDALAIFLGEEAVLVGDTVLPDITPMPTQEKFFHQVERILHPNGGKGRMVYGLKTYIRSLKKLDQHTRQMPNLLVLPAHRLYYNNRWNDIHLEERIDQIIGHHIRRCGDIMEIVGKGNPKTAGEIALAHFEPHLLKGMGMAMAENEVLSHCELLMGAGDLRLDTDSRFTPTGESRFESAIASLEPE